MNQNILGNQYSPTILIAKDYQEELKLDSQILASSNQVYVPVVNATEILSWVQQHQPDLIILDLEYPKIVESGIVTALKLDWLTRRIPIVVVCNLAKGNCISQEDLDCDAYLAKPYLERELEKVICSLVSSPACEASTLV